MAGDSPFLGSVCSPPVKPRKLFRKECAQCGSGPFTHNENESPLCSDECKKKYKKRNIGKEKHQKRLEKQKAIKQTWSRVARCLTERKIGPVKVQAKFKSSQKVANDSKFLRRKFGPSFYTSEKWVAIRYEVLKRDKMTCQCCGADKKDGVKMHVDHIKPRSKYPELEYDINNLQVLCDACNIGKKNSDEIDWRNPCLR